MFIFETELHVYGFVIESTRNTVSTHRWNSINSFADGNIVFFLALSYHLLIF